MYAARRLHSEANMYAPAGAYPKCIPSYPKCILHSYIFLDQCSWGTAPRFIPLTTFSLAKHDLRTNWKSSSLPTIPHKHLHQICPEIYWNVRFKQRRTAVPERNARVFRKDGPKSIEIPCGARLDEAAELEQRNSSMNFIIRKLDQKPSWKQPEEFTRGLWHPRKA